jgi:hypothetical protein
MATKRAVEMDTKLIAQSIVDNVGLIKKAHIEHAKKSDDSVRFHDRSTPYIIHPLWCAMTIMTETKLPENLRLNGYQTLMWHDVLEDTDFELPNDMNFEIISMIQDMSFDSFEFERELIWQKSTFIRLLKLYDKTSNLLDASHLTDQKWNAYVDFTQKLIMDAEQNYGELNIVKISKSIAIYRQR